MLTGIDTSIELAKSQCNRRSSIAGMAMMAAQVVARLFLGFYRSVFMIRERPDSVAQLI